jgi:pSer/pThr/pTyr-binding forkhead associated (FHA) protein
MEDPGTTGPFSLEEGLEVEGPSLVVRSGSLEGVAFPLEGDNVTVGRSPSCEIFLNDVTVSRNHARITIAPGTGVRLRDLGSLNGTYVNRRRIEEEEVLEHGDELQIGKFRLVYFAG